MRSYLDFTAHVISKEQPHSCVLSFMEFAYLGSFLSGYNNKKASSGGGQFDFLSGRAGKRASSTASDRKVSFVQAMSLSDHLLRGHSESQLARLYQSGKMSRGRGFSESTKGKLPKQGSENSFFPILRVFPIFHWFIFVWYMVCARNYRWKASWIKRHISKTSSTTHFATW